MHTSDATYVQLCNFWCVCAVAAAVAAVVSAGLWRRPINAQVCTTLTEPLARVCAPWYFVNDVMAARMCVCVCVLFVSVCNFLNVRARALYQRRHATAIGRFKMAQRSSGSMAGNALLD